MAEPTITPPIGDVKNIILLSVDSLRVDRLHSERNGVPLTPNIDTISKNAIEFREGISPGPSTRDTMPSLMTGAYPSQFSNVGLPEAGIGPKTLPELVSDAGFSTGGFSNNNFISRKYNHDRGFDRYYDVSVEGRKEQSRGAWRIPVRNFIDGTPLMSLAHSTHSFLMENFGASLFLSNEGGSNLTGRALDWLDQTKGNRFLWLHYMDTHHPYIAPDEIQQKYGDTFSERRTRQLSEKTRSDPEGITDDELSDLNYLYDCTVRYVDEQIERVLTHLREQDELQESLIIVTADHGEAFGEQGDFGHTNGLWDELICVPLIIYHPDIGRMFVDGQAPLRLLVESVANGTGWFDMLENGQEYVVSEVPEFRAGMRSCRGNGYKLITRDDSQIATQIGENGEEIISVDDIPDNIYDDLVNQIEVDRDRIDVSVSISEEELQDDLEALGYLQ